VAAPVALPRGSEGTWTTSSETGRPLGEKHFALLPKAPPADAFPVGPVLLMESHTVSDDPPRPLDQVARLIIDHEGDVTVEVGEAARSAT
jgi:hypothetical protein